MLQYVYTNKCTLKEGLNVDVVGLRSLRSKCGIVPVSYDEKISGYCDHNF